MSFLLEEELPSYFYAIKNLKDGAPVSQPQGLKKKKMLEESYSFTPSGPDIKILILSSGFPNHNELYEKSKTICEKKGIVQENKEDDRIVVIAKVVKTGFEILSAMGFW